MIQYQLIKLIHLFMNYVREIFWEEVAHMVKRNVHVQMTQMNHLLVYVMVVGQIYKRYH